MRKYKIYLITNTVNGKKYVGQTKESPASERLKSHIGDMNRGSELPIHRAMRKHGVENFEFVVAEDWDTLEEANEAEIWWIQILDAMNPNFGYNCLPGGRIQTTPDVWKKISESRKKAFQERPELREKVSQARKGKPISKEHHEKMVEGRRAVGWNFEPHTDEYKQKMSETLKAMHASGERKHTGGPKKGRKFRPRTDEEKKQISENLKKQWADGTRKARKPKDDTPKISRSRRDPKTGRYLNLRCEGPSEVPENEKFKMPPRSEEHRRKISEGLKRAHVNHPGSWKIKPQELPQAA